jgi:hypothetical protein
MGEEIEWGFNNPSDFKPKDPKKLTFEETNEGLLEGSHYIYIVECGISSHNCNVQ